MLTDILIFHKRQQNRVHIKSESTLHETLLGTCSFQAESNQLCRVAGSLVSCFPVIDTNFWLINSDLPSSSPITPWGCGNTETRYILVFPPVLPLFPEAVGVHRLETISGPLWLWQCQDYWRFQLAPENIWFSVIRSSNTVEACTITPWMSPIVTGLSEIGDIFRLFFFPGRGGRGKSFIKQYWALLVNTLVVAILFFKLLQVEKQ